MLKSLEVLEVSGARLTGQLPKEWVDATALRVVAVKALSAAQQASARATSFAKKVSRSARNAQSTGSIFSSNINSGAIFQANTRAVVATKAADALGAVVQDSNNGVPLGLMNLRVLAVTGHKLSGGLPEGYSKLKQLEVLDVSRTPMAYGTAGLTGPLPPSYAALEKLKVCAAYWQL
jgi:hypothetical protein